jgi:hypothetical protein
MIESRIRAFLARNPLGIRFTTVAVVRVLTRVGLADQLDEQATEDAVNLVLDGLAALVALLWSRAAVTPVADPVLPAGKMVRTPEGELAVVKERLPR